jgi:flagellar hook-associated protein 2
VATGISFSGFNGIDFSVIVNAVMAQERQPLTALQSQQTALKTRTDQLQTLATRIGAVESAARALSAPVGLLAFTATSSDTAAVSAAAGPGAQAGRYEVEVSALARAQVTVSGTVSDPAADVATGGIFRIGTTDIPLGGSTSLNGLASAINARTDLGVRATVIQSGNEAYRLVLTATHTGTAGAFTLTDLTSGGRGFGFIDTDGDGTTGDTDADNAAVARNAELRINSVPVSSSSNTVTAVPGVTLTLGKETTAPVAVEVAADPATARTRMQALVTAYNELVDFMNAQVASAQRNEAASLGREPVLRQARSLLRTRLQATQTTSTVFSSASQVGLEFTSSGKLVLDATAFDQALVSQPTEVAHLFRGDGSTTGVFTQVASGLKAFTDASGVIKTLRTTLADRSTRLTRQIVTLEGRLNQRRLALQQEFTAAEQAMSRLQSQSGALANFQASKG